MQFCSDKHLTSIWLKCRSFRLPCSGLILRCVARRSIHLFIACVLINHTHTPFFFKFFFFFHVGKNKLVFPIKSPWKENAGPYSELFIYIRRLWSREVKMVSLSWQMVHLPNPHRTLRTQRKVVRAASVVHFRAAWELPLWPSSLAALQPSELEQILFVLPFNPPILQHLRGSSRSFLCKSNFFFFSNAKTW